jgi:hypothetical protein
MKTEDQLALVNSGFLREKEMDRWRATAGDPYPMEKNPDEVPIVDGVKSCSSSPQAYGWLGAFFTKEGPP